MTDDKILATIAEWRSKLLDLTKRNRLINCRIGPKGAVELLHPSPEHIWECLANRDSALTFAMKTRLVEASNQPKSAKPRLENSADGSEEARDEAPERRAVPLELCLSSPKLKPDHILTDCSDAQLSNRLNRLSLNARTSIEEQGVNILYIGFGLLQWYEAPQSDVALNAPLLLLPVSLKRSDVGDLWTLRPYENEIVENQCLKEMLRSSFRFELPEYLAGDEDVAPDPNEYFKRIRRFLSRKEADKRWQVLPKVVLQTFSFQNIAMWEDLGKNAERIASHPICRGLAGDFADMAFGTDGLPSPSEFDDKIAPSDVHSILDSDSSQMEAVVAAKHGVNLIVDGPPGTGKSQTIANIIAECLASNRTVLFVSEKVAALDVVKRRLDSQNLGDFCLECHSHKANKKQILAELNRCLSLPAERYRDQTAQLKELFQIRTQLNSYVKAIHERKGALAASPFQIQGRLAAMKSVRSTRAHVNDPLAISATELKETERLCSRLAQYDPIIANYQNHPWNGLLTDSFSFALRDKIESALGGFADAVERLVPHIELLSKFGLGNSAPRFSDLPSTLGLVQELLAYPLLPADWFKGDAVSLAHSILSLHQVEREVDSLADTVREFNIDNGPIPKHLEAAVSSFARHPYLRNIQLRQGATVRGLKRQVESSLVDLARFRHRVAGLRDAVADFSTHFGFRISPNSSLGVLHKLVALEALIADVGHLRTAWFESTRRDELLGLKEKCKDDIQISNTIAAQHSETWTGLAYEPFGADIAQRAIEFEPFWWRIWAMLNGRWRQFGEECRQVFRSQLPPTIALILEDFRLLRDYHRRTDRVREIVARHRDDLVFDAQGQPDWDALHHGLDVIGRLQSLIKVPEELKQHLCSGTEINRDALHESAVSIREMLTQLDAQALEIGQQFSLNELGERRLDYKNLSSSDLETQLREAEDALAELRKGLAEIEFHLASQADITINSFPEAVRRLDSLLEQRQRIADGRTKLAEVSGSNGKVVSLHGVSAEDVTAANATIEVVKKYSDRPAIQAISILSDAVVREQVRRATIATESIFEELNAFRTDLRQFFRTDESLPSGVIIDKLSLQDVASWSRELCGQLNKLEQWVELQSIRSELDKRGLNAIFKEVLDGSMTSVEAANAYRAKFFRQWLDAIYAEDPVLSKFQADQHEELLDEFRGLDRDSIDGAYKRIRTKLLEDPERPRLSGISAPPSSELGVLLREASRKRPRMPLRQLFRKVPRILLRVKPCVMMSPLAVSTFLDSPELEFDIVIFDEASQVRPYDAIGAIYRGKQLLVAGDQKQLPPTRFFDALDTDSDRDDDEDDDDAGSLSDFESILDKCCSLGMPRKRLRWHYRSRRESLITFSNRFIYNNELITFPSVLDTQDSSAVTHHFVPNGRWVPTSSGSGGINPVEADELAKLVVRQLEQEPDKSLGVITFNQAQQMAVLERLREIRSNRSDLAELLNESRDEPIIVKNIETVQGDERDVIILGVAYNRRIAGNKLSTNFGPLNRPGGERRLNVAITRARYKAIVVSSFHADEIDLKNTNSRGVMLLRNYLDFASRGIQALDAATTEFVDAECDSEFEVAVESALKGHGLDVRRQIGCSGFRIDLAIVHPDHPGKYVLGVECDGATYHGTATARDRDRLRQEILEGLGWRFCRIWSTDWVRNPERQIQRVVDAYEDALANSNVTHDESAQPTDGNKPTDREPEKPTILRIAKNTRRATYPSIEEVPEDVIQDAVMQILRLCGQTTQDDLIRSVARELGFLRTGHKIQNRIGHTIKQLAREKQINWADEDSVAAS